MRTIILTYINGNTDAFSVLDKEVDSIMKALEDPTHSWITVDGMKIRSEHVITVNVR
jgi:hypothetical protein